MMVINLSLWCCLGRNLSEMLKCLGVYETVFSGEKLDRV